MQPLRTQIGIFGRMNAGKSTFLNRLTSNNVSIVDQTPGTTADAKVTLMEIHGLGPCRLFDTAGLDELGRLGAKKRAKTLKVMEFCDVVVHVVNPSVKFDRGVRFPSSEQFGKLPLSEVMTDALWAAGCDGEVEARAGALKKPIVRILNDWEMGDSKIVILRKEKQFVEIRANLTKTDPHELASIIKQISGRRHSKKSNFLPKMLTESAQPKRVLLIIPLDAQSPQLRLLRPQ